MWTISISKQKTMTTTRTKASFPIYCGVYLMCISFIVGLTSCLPPDFLRTKVKRKRSAWEESRTHKRAQVWFPQRKKSLLTDHIWAIYSKLVFWVPRIWKVVEYILIFHISFCSSENPFDYNLTSVLPKTEMTTPHCCSLYPTFYDLNLACCLVLSLRLNDNLPTSDFRPISVALFSSWEIQQGLVGNFGSS